MFRFIRRDMKETHRKINFFRSAFFLWLFLLICFYSISSITILVYQIIILFWSKFFYWSISFHSERDGVIWKIFYCFCRFVFEIPGNVSFKPIIDLIRKMPRGQFCSGRILNVRNCLENILKSKRRGNRQLIW